MISYRFLPVLGLSFSILINHLILKIFVEIILDVKFFRRTRLKMFGQLSEQLFQLAQTLGVNLEERLYEFLTSQLGHDGWMRYADFRQLEITTRVRVFKIMLAYLSTIATNPRFQRVSRAFNLSVVK